MPSALVLALISVEAIRPVYLSLFVDVRGFFFLFTRLRSLCDGDGSMHSLGVQERFMFVVNSLVRLDYREWKYSRCSCISSSSHSLLTCFSLSTPHSFFLRRPRMKENPLKQQASSSQSRLARAVQQRLSFPEGEFTFAFTSNFFFPPLLSFFSIPRSTPSFILPFSLFRGKTLPFPFERLKNLQKNPKNPRKTHTTTLSYLIPP